MYKLLSQCIYPHLEQSFPTSQGFVTKMTLVELIMDNSTVLLGWLFLGNEIDNAEVLGLCFVQRDWRRNPNTLYASVKSNWKNCCLLQVEID